MKMPALLAAAVALSACSTSESITEQSTERALTPLEAIDIAEAPAAEAQKIEPATTVIRTETPELEVVTANSPAPNGDAICTHGALDEARSFVICEDGALRKAGVVAALSGSHDPNLKIEEVAAKFEVPPQVFSGIQSATYGTLINGNRHAPRGGSKPKSQTGLVQIEGKVYEVYQLSAKGKNGTIFVEQKSK